MARAYVMLEVEPAEIHRALAELTKIPEVKEFDAITGNFDVIVLIEGLDSNDIGQISAGSIAKIRGVRRTVTYNVVKL